MADESATYLEDLLDLDDDLESLTIAGAGRTVTITADEARSQGRRKRLVPPEHFDGQDFKRDDHLEILANQLIAAHPTTLGHIRNVRVAYLWKRKGGGKGGCAAGSGPGRAGAPAWPEDAGDYA